MFWGLCGIDGSMPERSDWYMNRVHSSPQFSWSPDGFKGIIGGVVPPLAVVNDVCAGEALFGVLGALLPVTLAR